MPSPISPITSSTATPASDDVLVATSVAAVVPTKPDSALVTPSLSWEEAGVQRTLRWRSERGASPPKVVVIADDSMSGDNAYRLASEGTGLLWRGDFQNARLLLQAMVRRADKATERKQEKNAKKELAAPTPLEAFNLHRQAQAQRARMLGMLLLEFGPDYTIALRRAPDVRRPCIDAWGKADGEPTIASLRELLGLVSANEWHKKGVEIPALGAAPDNRIYPRYGVFSPQRGEYVDLVATTPLPKMTPSLAFDIGTGTGVLAAVLAKRGVESVIATELDKRAMACADENLKKLGLFERVKVRKADLFPEGQAGLIVCNPPWLPARPSSPIEMAVYDEGSRMLLGFLAGLSAHLAPRGEGWLILSDFAEHLGLRTRTQLLDAIAAAGLKVLGRIDAQPRHPKVQDKTDALHAARAAEVTSLWRLAAV